MAQAITVIQADLGPVKRPLRPLPVRFRGAPATMTSTHNLSDKVQVLLNPTTLEESLAAEYQRQSVVSLPYEPVQFTRTRNRTISVSLYVSLYEYFRQHPGPLKFDAYDDVRRFLQAHVHPVDANRAPPAVLFSWAQVATFVGVIEDLRIRYEVVSTTGVPLIYSIDVTFMEVRALRLFNDVRTFGIADPTGPGVALALGNITTPTPEAAERVSQFASSLSTTSNVQLVGQF